MRFRASIIAGLAIILGLVVPLPPATAAGGSVTIATVTGGSGTAVVTDTLEEGIYNYQIEAVPDDGYEFRDWDCDFTVFPDETANPATLVNVSRGVTCEPRFVEKTFTVSLGSATGGKATVPVFVGYFGTGTLRAFPDEGFIFTGWTCDGGTISPSAKANPATLGTVRSDVTCTPSFAEAVPVSVTIGATTGGSGTAAPTPILGDVPVTLTATADAGYSFSRWECTSGSLSDPTANPATLSGLTEDTTCTPIFAADTQPLPEPTPTDPTPTPTPEPTPTVRKAQSPRNAQGMAPKRIRTAGVTVLTGSNARTNADQLIRTRVRCTLDQHATAGEVRLCKVQRGANGKVTLRTFGQEHLKVVVVQSAPATSAYEAYRKVTVYTDGKKG